MAQGEFLDQTAEADSVDLRKWDWCRALGPVGAALALAGVLAACSPAATGHSKAAVPVTAPASPNTTGSTLPSISFSRTYTEIVQSQSGVGTFEYFDAIGGGYREPYRAKVQVGCVAHDPANQILSVVDGDWYVLAKQDSNGFARITPTNSYDNTTDPAVLAKPLDEQPVYDHSVPFCTAEQLGALGLNPPPQQ